MSVKGYKVFNSDWTCRGFQYAVGETFKHNGNIEMCGAGFHFCTRIADCFNYYRFDSSNKVAEIEAIGDVITGDDKSVTNEIKIIREISWHEVLELANTGKDCTGCSNSGNYNSGNCNSGYCNSSDFNSGSWNSCSFSTGFFNSVPQPIYAFNKPLDMKRKEFYDYKGVQILNDNFSLTQWITENDMTDKEKEEHPDYKTTGGYSKTLDFKTACERMWEQLTEEEKKEVCRIPNFDADVFKEITGIDVGGV